MFSSPRARTWTWERRVAGTSKSPQNRRPRMYRRPRLPQNQQISQPSMWVPPIVKCSILQISRDCRNWNVCDDNLLASAALGTLSFRNFRYGMTSCSFSCYLLLICIYLAWSRWFTSAALDDYILVLPHKAEPIGGLSRNASISREFCLSW